MEQKKNQNYHETTETFQVQYYFYQEGFLDFRQHYITKNLNFCIETVVENWNRIFLDTFLTGIPLLF